MEIKCPAEMHKLHMLFWQLRTGIKIQTRYGGRMISCQESVCPKGEVRLVIDYRSQVDPDRRLPMLAKRLIWTSGFGQAIRSC